MLTALVLQLIQCTVVPPRVDSYQAGDEGEEKEKSATPNGEAKEDISKKVRGKK